MARDQCCDGRNGSQRACDAAQLQATVVLAPRPLDGFWMVGKMERGKTGERNGNTEM